MSRSGPNYTETEVRALIENYEVLRETIDTHPRKLNWLVLRTDLDAVLARLPEKYWEVVLLHGLIGFSLVETSLILQVSHQAVSKRYRHGIDEVVFYINGGT